MNIDVTNKYLVLRVDANTAIGSGHLMRCIALAKAWQDKHGLVCFVFSSISDVDINTLKKQGFETVDIDVEPGSDEDALLLSKLACDKKANWVVVDGYIFDDNYQKKIVAQGLPLLFVDDYGQASSYSADLILNQNYSAQEKLYRNRKTSSRLLLGRDYVLLRPEFLKFRGHKRQFPEVAKKVLVSLGGSDPDNVTLLVLKALALVNVKNIEVTVVIGPNNPHYQQIVTETKNLPITFSFVKNVFDMSQYMAVADVGVSAGGSTCWEQAFMQLPALVVILADNQIPVAEALSQKGCVINAGFFSGIALEDLARKLEKLLCSAKLRKNMAREGAKIIDGYGAQRVVEAMTRSTLKLREIERKDCELLWCWANDNGVRSAAFQTKQIEWQEHLKWFTEKTNDCHCYHYVAFSRDEDPVGQVRFDIDTQEAEIDVSLAKEKRGNGLGVELIRLAVEKLIESTMIRKIHAFVKEENFASVRVFRKAGFRENGKQEKRGYSALHFVWENTFYWTHKT